MKVEQKIFFGTKEENNVRRQKEFLALSPHERLVLFLRLCEEMEFFESAAPHPNRLKDNFVLE